MRAGVQSTIFRIDYYVSESCLQIQQNLRANLEYTHLHMCVIGIVHWGYYKQHLEQKSMILTHNIIVLD